MSLRKGKVRRKPYIKAALMGIVSAALYGVLLTEQDTINKYFTLGGFYALLPIVVAFVFSFVHGSFTGNFWTVLGIEAAKKKKEAK